MTKENLTLEQVNKGLIEQKRRPILTIKMKAFIFDIDGVLSNPSHRIEHANNKDWDKFNSLAYLDKPILGSINVCRSIDVANNHEIIFMTGRSEKFRELTENWLIDNIFSGIQRRKLNLIMRPNNDLRRSAEYKFSEYEKLKNSYNIIGVFEDNEYVVKMWQDQGLTCFALPSMYNND